MKANEVIKALMKLRGYTCKSLADKLGKSTPSAVSNTLIRRTSMKIDTLVEYANTMDCEVIIRSKLKDKSEWVIK